MNSKNPADVAACPLCGTTSCEYSTTVNDSRCQQWHLWNCSVCGTAFIHPMPSANVLSQYYSNEYYGKGDRKFAGPGENIACLFRYLRARKIQRMIRRGRVLDIGCGRGVMLKYLKGWGCDVDGLEIDGIAHERAAKNLGQKIFLDIEGLEKLPSNYYQAICFWHSLEHLTEPRRALAVAHRLLSPGGVLIISAPNFKSIQRRLSGSNWLHLDIPRHLTHFDMEVLASFFKGRGYSLIRHNHFSFEYNPIDTLCFLYAQTGFPPLYPFDLAHSATRHAHDTLPLSRKIAGLCLAFPFLPVAALASSFFSLLRSGSTTTIFLRKINDKS